jgi:hypothetical protein
VSARHAAWRLAACAALCLLPGAAPAQGGSPFARPDSAPEAPPTGPRSVRGRIVRPTPAGDAPVSGVWVVLHRVGPDRSGPLDSTRTRADGAYRFAYVASGSGEAIYFVSAMYGGIAYFGAPLHHAAVEGDEAIVTVFDTSSAPLPIRVHGRHVVVSGSDADERRRVTEVYELSNDTSLTRVGGARDSATFRAGLPRGARDFAGGQGDVTPQAMGAVDGRVEVYAPLAPGIKQFSFSYTLDKDAFPLAMPVERGTGLLEVLAEDERATVDGARLVRQDSLVRVGGRMFARWLAEDVPASAIARVSFEPAPRGLGGQGAWLAAMIAVALAGLSLTVVRVAGRRRGLYDPAPVHVAGPDPEQLARRIAALDAAFERERAPTSTRRAEYTAQRDALKRELTDALAARDARR